ncbi:ligase-associated DNA damage response endonuclease PdeM, partial [Xanthomonas campestris]
GVTILPAYSHFTAGIVPNLVEGERLVAWVVGDAMALPVR